MKFFPALLLILITLKLTNFIAWSWFWVLSPIWVVILLAIALALIVDDRTFDKLTHKRK